MASGPPAPDGGRPAEGARRDPVDAVRIADRALRADGQAVDVDVLPRRGGILHLVGNAGTKVADPVVHGEVREAVARRRRPFHVRPRKGRARREPGRAGQVGERRHRLVVVAARRVGQRRVPVAVGRQQMEIRLALAGHRIERIRRARQARARQIAREELADAPHRVGQRRAAVRTDLVGVGEPGLLVGRREILDVREQRVVLPERVEADARVLVERRERDAGGRLHRQYPRPVERIPVGEIGHLLRVRAAARIRGRRAVDEEAGRLDVDAGEGLRIERRRARAVANVLVGRRIPLADAGRRAPARGVLGRAELDLRDRVVVGIAVEREVVDELALLEAGARGRGVRVVVAGGDRRRRVAADRHGAVGAAVAAAHRAVGIGGLLARAPSGRSSSTRPCPGSRWSDRWWLPEFAPG